MTTTKSKVSKGKKNTADSSRQPKAVIIRSRFSVLRTLKKVAEKHLDDALNITKNGTLKLTLATPDVKEDVKGSLVVDGKTFFLVPASPSKKGIITALASYLDFVHAKEILARKVENTKAFEDWCKTAEAQKQFRLSKMLLGRDLTDTEKKSAYNLYLGDRGLDEADNAADTGKK